MKTSLPETDRFLISSVPGDAGTPNTPYQCSLRKCWNQLRRRELPWGIAQTEGRETRAMIKLTVCALKHNLSKTTGYASKHPATRYASKHVATFYALYCNVYFMNQCPCGSGSDRALPPDGQTPVSVTSRLYVLQASPPGSLCSWASWARNHNVSQNPRMHVTTIYGYCR